MRVLHILDHSIPLHSGYAFRTQAILHHQRALGWETFQLTSPKHAMASPPCESVDGYEFYRTPAVPVRWSRLPALGELALMQGLARRLSELIPEIRPDILHAHSPVLNALPAVRAGSRFDLPVVYEVRASWEDAAISHGTSQPGGLRYRLSRAVETFAVKRADAVTTICQGLREDLIARGLPPDAVTVIPNAVDLEHFAGDQGADRALAEALDLDGKTVLGFIGSFYAYEGLHLLVQALPGLLERHPTVRLLLVGGGPEEARLRSLARRLGVAKRVIFAGRVDHDRVRAYYGLADLMIYPRQRIRLTELVTPLKPLEAMAQGKIVLASDVGGHRELIRKGKTGYLFEPDDAAALGATVSRVIEERSHWPQVIDRARRFVESERTWSKSVDRYRDVYTRLRAAKTEGTARETDTPEVGRRGMESRLRSGDRGQTGPAHR